MKKILILIGAILTEETLYAQMTPSENYVSTKTFLEYSANGSAKVAQKVQYFDGLSRPKQVIDVRSSPEGKDVVTHFEYDKFGRSAKTYLPVPQQGSQYGGIYTLPLDNASSTYGQEKIYSEKTLENAPLNRVEQDAPVGWDWSTRPVYFENGSNGTADKVRMLTTNTTIENNATKSEIQSNDYYAAGQLFKKTIWDEDGSAAIEFTNGKGQVILSRKAHASFSDNVDTYYIYNEYGQLAWVIPPQLSFNQDWTDADLKLFAYEYRYDGRGRQVEKRLPGKGREYMIYDKQDRLILSQDSVMKKKGKWMFTKYDAFGRVVYTGIVDNTSSRYALQVLADNNGGITSEARGDSFDVPGGTYTVNYSNNAFPTEFTEILTVNYYDTYPDSGDFRDFSRSILGQEVLAATRQDKANGLLMGTWAKNLDSNEWSESFFAYDTRGREISTYSVNYLKGFTRTEKQLNFSGLPNKVITYHQKDKKFPETVITETFAYDQQNRLAKHWHQVNSEPAELLTDMSYNEISQVANKKVGNNLQSIDYTYNIRGWNTLINNPENLNGKLFGYAIRYQNPVTNALLARYNGNISEVDWKSAVDDKLRRYSYEYDHMNRLLKGIYSEPSVTVPANNAYNERVYYDFNGNITELRRNALIPGVGVQEIDYLSYNYSGNRLLSVNENSAVYGGYPEVSGNTIEYDDNGNMTSQADKGILKINYNYLNLPNYITFDPSYILHTSSNGRYNILTNYTYAADGRKLEKRHEYGFVGGSKVFRTKINYFDGFQYTDDVLSFVPTSEGYYDFVKKKYIYHYTDHLGNIRLSYFRNNTGIEILEENNYYPFGMKHEGYNTLGGNPSYNYKYNGKELQENGMYDYGARFYMADLGRWGVVDPLAEKMTRHSPYNYTFNNPIRFIDPDGKDPGDFINEQGKLIGNDGKKDGKVYLIKTTQTEFDNGANFAGITKDQAKETEKFIKDNSGNTPAFDSNNIAYSNSVEIEGSPANRQSIINIVNNDTGSGGTSDANNREYGGIIRNGNVIESPAGPVGNPKTSTEATITHPDVKKSDITFHSHPSGQIIEGSGGGSGVTVGGTTTTYGWGKAPSSYDISNARGTGYVFSRNNGTVYIFNRSGVTATIPQKRFVEPKK
ncbi:MAG TPA: sugar-binding protein [Chryseobacterium sp.]|nr:sugar-binding protein [Chryseobacterium sp.]